MFLNIRAKIIGTTLLILFIGIFLCSIIINFIFINEHIKVLKTNSTVLAYNLKFKIEKLLHLGLEIDGIEGFDKQCKEIVESYGTISTAMILDKNGRILYYYYDRRKAEFYDDGESDKIYITKPEIFKEIDLKNLVSRSIKIKGSMIFELFIPVIGHDNVPVGIAGVAFPYNLILSKIKSLFFITFFISLLSFAIAVVLLLYIITQSVTNPLKKLVKIIDEIKENSSLDKRVDIKSEDELGSLASAFNMMLEELDKNRKELIEKNKIQKELEIARDIQTSILPKKIAINGYQIATFMKTAEEVGGDYYDVIRTTDDESWLSIGDVTGHGVTAGLIMIMLQSIFASLVNINSDFKKSPEKIYNLCNKVIYDNLKNRMFLNQFITACFMRVFKNGVVEYAGAHEHILIYRSNTKKVEILETDGLWLGMLSDITNITKTNSVKLNKNDLLFVYTDGLTQVKNSEGKQYTLERVVDFFQNNAHLDVNTIKENLNREIEQFRGEQYDDISFLILKKE